MDSKYIYTMCEHLNIEELLLYEVDFHLFFEAAHLGLQRRSANEIDQLLWEIDKSLLVSYSESGVTANNEKWISDLRNLSLLYPSRSQIVFLLQKMKKGEPPSAISNLPDITWIECFSAALLGHAYIAKYIEANNLLEIIDGYDFYFDLSECVGRFAITCTEIYVTLEHIEGFEYQATLLNAKREQAKEAARQRHKESNSLKNRYCDWYFGDGSSIRKGMGYGKAAEYFWSNIISATEQDSITVGNLEKALRSHLKNNK